MSAAPASSRPARPSWRRRLARHALRFVLVSAVLLGPNLVFYGRWFVPDEPLPAVPAAVAHVDAAGLPPALSSDLAAALAAGRARTGLPSVSAAIAWDGDVRWAGASGFADIEHDVAASTRSRYRTGSIAKPITALAMMRLVDAGALDLDAPLSDVVPDLPAHIAPLTARQLASHQAGIRHYSRVPQWWMGWHENFSQRHYASVADGLSLFLDDPLRFAPGTGFQYSTFGYSLLARALEGASGDDFPALLHDTVFVPAGMTGTALDSPTPMPGRVAFYQAKDGLYTPAWPIDSSYKIAGGGLVATPTDLVRFGAAVLDGRLLSATARDEMLTRQPLADGAMNPENYALGWRIDESVRLLGADRPVTIWHHGGMQPGAAAFLMILPRHGIVVAAMANSGSGPAREEVQETAYALARLAMARDGGTSAPAAAR